MTGRAFHIKVQLDVHAVTCPGVWLCPNGKVVLRINALDSCAESHAISPIFPLLFHEKFTFDKIFVEIISLTELQKTLEQEFFYAELIQWIIPASQGITLATFETNLADLLYPAPCFKGLLAGVNVDLLMEPTKYFPGIIAPKIEVSTKTVIEEILEFYASKYVTNPNINSKQTMCRQRKRPIKGIIRQRKVCHIKNEPRSQSCRPFCQRSNESHQCSSNTTNHQTGSQSDQYYQSIRRNSYRSDFPKLAGSAIICDNTHVTNNCPVCFKYNYYFPKYNDCDIIKKCVDNKQRHFRNLSDIRECDCICRNGAFDTQEEGVMPLLQSKIENLQKSKEKWYTTKMTDNIEECDPKYEYIQDYSPSHGFYKNLEKFYKRMYKQAKMRAREID
ncbi:PREDICTED: spermatogenesis-associated protein 6 isoform X1 [Acromyrmex echinatior]|uniref:spermatogenesis-associated protein 6 isoform X1 n=1 Tax=Acromyrmex echinatior TaxID=103372 RepID=UPI000580C642|nr:PREDICTED: spermatogenesis-associated protein 6 isoform X1 [Acromyrmex echinatior]XP_011055794.1 PREDICTED: spermatogenesis-associated protein 6 isoform X1 [Acromyrmex echinatior]